LRRKRDSKERSIKEPNIAPSIMNALDAVGLALEEIRALCRTPGPFVFIFCMFSLDHW
jgi:hypothetical protein